MRYLIAVHLRKQGLSLLSSTNDRSLDDIDVSAILSVMNEQGRSNDINSGRYVAKSPTPHLPRRPYSRQGSTDNALV